MYGIQYTTIEVIKLVEKANILKNLKNELRKGNLVLAVLSQLKNKHYGYSLVETLNKKNLKIDQNTLYPLLRRLDTQGLLTSTWEVIEPRPRKYYELSHFGKEILEQLKDEFENNYQVLNAMLKEEK